MLMQKLKTKTEAMAMHDHEGTKDRTGEEDNLEAERQIQRQ